MVGTSLSYFQLVRARQFDAISIQSINRQVTYNYKFVRQEDSMSSSLSLLALLTSLCMKLLSLTALLKGLLVVWAKKVSSAKDGALSFLGPRSLYLHTVAQPNPSEGDVTSFWYYRKHLNQVWQGLVLKVIKVLTCNLKTLPILQFFHLRKLLPHLYPDAFCVSPAKPTHIS